MDSDYVYFLVGCKAFLKIVHIVLVTTFTCVVLCFMYNPLQTLMGDFFLSFKFVKGGSCLLSLRKNRSSEKIFTGLIMMSPKLLTVPSKSCFYRCFGLKFYLQNTH